MPHSAHYIHAGRGGALLETDLYECATRVVPDRERVAAGVSDEPHTLPA